MVSMNNVDFGKVLDKPTDDAKGAKEEGYTHVWDIDDSNTPVKFTVQAWGGEVRKDSLWSGSDVEGSHPGVFLFCCRSS